MYFEKNCTEQGFYEHIMPERMNLCDREGLSIDQMKSIVKYEVTKNPKIKTVVIDYAQLLRGKGNEYERLTHISQVCPEIAKAYNVRVILLCQLRKDSYDNSRPTINLIKGAGGLYDNSNMVFCLYKDRSIEDNRKLELLHWKDRENGSEGLTYFLQNGLHINSVPYGYFN